MSYPSKHKDPKDSVECPIIFTRTGDGNGMKVEEICKFMTMKDFFEVFTVNKSMKNYLDKTFKPFLIKHKKDFIKMAPKENAFDNYDAIVKKNGEELTYLEDKYLISKIINLQAKLQIREINFCVDSPDRSEDKLKYIIKKRKVDVGGNVLWILIKWMR
ncbi:MAG: hypothetical protein MJ252_21125 [archaeon]|nr:hypothetical protein [archaeon]